ncbi:MAG: hypothetical protein QW587_04765 [Candidatus Bathyarchaeia archaeon]
MSQVLNLIPVTVEVQLFRIYAGSIYPRDDLIFGEKETIYAQALVRDLLGFPLGGVNVEVYLDGVRVGSAVTNMYGLAGYVFSQGIPQGRHVVKMRWPGDWLHDAAQAELGVTTVPMVPSSFRAYVDSVGWTNTGQIEASLMSELLKQQIGAIVTEIRIKQEPPVYIFTILVPYSETSSTVLALAPAIIIAVLIVAAIVAILALAPTLVQYVSVYITGQYQCGVDGQTFLTCVAYKEHLMTAHPEVWEAVKNDPGLCETPSAGIPWEVVLLAGLGVAGLFGVAYLIKALK